MKRLGTQPFSERIERANKLINRMQFAHGFKTKTAKCATANIDCFGEIISWVNYGFLCRRRTISRCHFINVSLGWRRQFDAFCSLITFKYSLLCVLNNLPFLTSSLAHLLRLSGNSVEKKLLLYTDLHRCRVLVPRICFYRSTVILVKRFKVVGFVVFLRSQN